MVALPRAVNIESEITRPSSKPNIPDGDHVAVIINSGLEASPYSSSGPQGVFFKIIITQGSYANTEFHKHLAIFDERPFNQSNPTWTYSKAGFGEISQIAQALGYSGDLPNGFETSEFHNKTLIITTKTKIGKDKEQNLKPEWNESIICAFKPYTSVKPNQSTQHNVQSGNQAQTAQMNNDTSDAVNPPVVNPFA